MSLRLMVFLAAFSLTTCDDDEGPADPKPPRAVRTMIVAQGGEDAYRTLPGVLTAAETMRLAFPVAGRLIDVPLRAGDRMTQGEAVARLDPADIEREITAAEAKLAAALARLDATDAEFQRQRTLFERGLVARAGFERISADLSAALADRRVAETDLAAARDRLDRITLRAPREGVVTALLANRFEELAAGQPVYEVAVTAALQAEVLAPEALLAVIAPGTPVAVRLPAFPDQSFAAEVTEIAADAEAGVAYRVKARLADPPEGAKTGFSAAVSFTLPRAAGAIDIPLSALIFADTRSEPTAGDSATVYVFDEATGTVRARQVRIDGVVGTDLLVTEGLSPGEHVVTAGVALLSDGEPVRLWSLPE
ncbi:Secretion protein HlyD family [Roseovarius sp. EC-HK134]|uniref:efflux RND transporter periplasmic adaptor subunit n=1 Tax=unclassified Roseovarius TaxID=2614913 RepID=UPI00015566D5|nr:MULTISPECIES: efflux RND transporter periplasmic adaptor subunit [unclassified Roseovarius]AWZ21988.1 putative Co/Zn/Cd efflux system membrane fusion protein [Roseovarius sp. AK1035]EDM29947.1 Secretion protein HlyD family [Roseovarius sp. TM1035]VVT33214.1 Secretion protein HlyD family [Roseovarius sp. EC-SD190]VVT33247.1 Secretion protein HlyD family [Roseovarius sp. EC-HK134]